MGMWGGRRLVCQQAGALPHVSHIVLKLESVSMVLQWNSSHSIRVNLGSTSKN